MRRCLRWVVPPGQASLISAVASYHPATLVVDVEPLIVPWGGDVQTCVERATGLFGALAEQVPSVTTLVFATNSGRPRSCQVVEGPVRTVLIMRAAKPWRAWMLRDLPRPIAVAGDQVLTDGILAWRLGALFLHCSTEIPVPWWPRVQAAVGSPAAAIFFTGRRR